MPSRPKSWIALERKTWQRFFASRREEFECMAAKARDEHQRGLTRSLEELLDAVPSSGCPLDSQIYVQSCFATSLPRS
jgi:hypothetical protein